MKLLLALSSLLLAGSISQAAIGPMETKEMVINVSDALVPTEASANSNVKAVISGMFPNGCYAYNRAEVDNSAKDGIVRVKAVADVSQGMCIMALIPFTKEVMLGHFTPGQYTIRFINGDDTYQDRSLTIQ